MLNKSISCMVLSLEVTTLSKTIATEKIFIFKPQHIFAGEHNLRSTNMEQRSLDTVTPMF